MKKIILTVGLISLSTHAFSEGNPSLLSITPSILQTTLRSDSETSVQYTLTNNTSSHLTGIIMPTWPAGISIPTISNTCTSSLAGATSCHFNILIQGKNQPSTLSLSPTICIQNGIICVGPDASHILTITTLPITDHAYAYLPILQNINENYSNNVVSANTTTPYMLNTAYTNNFDFTSDGGPRAGGIAVSKDGRYAYVVDRGNKTVNILSLTQGQMTPIHSLLFTNNNLQSITVNPAGTRAYVSAGTTVYAINVNDKSDPVLIGPPMTIDSETFSMAISPDGSTLYIPCPYGGHDANGTIDIFNLNNDVNTAFHTPLSYTTLTTPFGAVVSPDGTAVYITNNAQYNAGVSEIINANDPATLSLNQRLISLPDNSYPEGLTISNDETTLYVVEDYENSKVAIINLNTLSSVTVDLGNASYSVGAALNPDGSKLFVTNNSSPPLTVVDLENGNQVSQAFDNRTDFGKSTARSNFIN